MAKYKAKNTRIDDICFDSRMEAEYYLKLKEDKENGLIKDFELQPVFELQESFKMGKKTIRSIKYIADFRVINLDGSSYIVDIKGFETADFKIKKKIYLYMFKEPLFLITYVKRFGGWVNTADLKALRKELANEQKTKKKQIKTKKSKDGKEWLIERTDGTYYKTSEI